MPRNYGRPFWRVTAAGTLYTAERWSLSLSLVGAADLGVPTQAHADTARQAIFSTIVRPNAGFGVLTGSATLTHVKVARIGADGLYGTANAVTSNQPLSGSAGSGTGGTYPPQIALAVTLLGPNVRAAAGRGRFYLPAPAVTMSSDGRITEAAALAVANRAAEMVNALNSGLPGDVCIIGPETSTGRAPAYQRVEAVKVGRVLDTIRSRRSSFPEEAVTSTTAVGSFSGGGGGF